MAAVNSKLPAPIPTLDGWRAIAISMVLWAHASGTIFYHGHPLSDIHWLRIGQNGVSIFFVLSGFLITSKLLEDCDLKKFYIRRAFRILPVVLCYLVVVSILGVATSKEVAASALFYRNYLPVEWQTQWFTSHFWSLAVEEHFYLLWPLIVSAFSIKSAKKLGIALTVCVALMRWYSANYLHQGNFLQYSHVRMDALLIGSLGALYWPEIRHWFSVRVFWLSGTGFVVTLATFRGYETVYESVFIFAMLACTISKYEHFSILDSKVFIFAGKLSFSIYVWQQVFINPSNFGPHIIPIIGLPLALSAAYVSYSMIEKPMISLGHRLATTSPQNISHLLMSRLSQVR